MSVSQEREEAEGHSETLTPESSPHTCVTTTSKNTDVITPTHSDEGSEVQRAASPVSSLVSMRSEASIIMPPNMTTETDGRPRLQSEVQRAASPVSSLVSMRSEASIDKPPNMTTETDGRPPLRKGKSEEHTVSPLRKAERSQSLPPHHTRSPESNHPQPTQHTGGGALKTLSDNHKRCLKRRFQNISESLHKPGSQVPINEVFTELYITEEKCNEKKDHEVWQVEAASRAQNSEDTPIHCNDIFTPLPGQQKKIRAVMTKGVAGIGKTVSVQKFILDWTDGVANQNIDFTFSLPFRELNLVRSHQHSLHTLLQTFHPELKDGVEYRDHQVAFIFDGLDESKSLNFRSNMSVCDVTQTASVDDLLSSLIQGNLLPSAFIWVTSRPAAVGQIPAKFFDRVTEIRGFTDSQKDKYFKKRIRNQSQANKIIAHIKSSRCLHIMCHIPVFCSIVATVLQQVLHQGYIPRTLTEIFIHFLLFQTTRKNQQPQNQDSGCRKKARMDQIHQRGAEPEETQPPESPKEIILKLAKLAFKNLENGNLMFYEEDLRECDIDVSKTSAFTGLCTEIFKEELVFQKKKVYCFVHLSVQEFLAALHVFVSYSYQMQEMGIFFCLEESLKFAITKALQSSNGHLDLFLRFLLGISLERNQRLLQGLLNHTHPSAECITNICRYVKELNREDISPERCVNLFHCLFEMNDESMHKEVQKYLTSKNFQQSLSPAHCSALAHVLLMSEETLDEFDLKRYNTTSEGRRRLLPAVVCAKKAKLDGCHLNKLSCETLRGRLVSHNSLVELDVSHNALGDSGVETLSAALSNPHCKLQTLRLVDCSLSEEAGCIVGKILQAQNYLKELHLSHNDLGDSGVENLANRLNTPHFKLQILRLSGCRISGKGCEHLASALSSNPSHLTELDLSYNYPGPSGIQILSSTLGCPDGTLHTLNFDHCAEIRLRPGVRKYACDLTLDVNTAQRNLVLSDHDRTATWISDHQPYPEHDDRFDYWPQVLSRERLSGRCYWEVEWSGDEARIAVTYPDISKRGMNVDSLLGRNDKSWTLYHSSQGFYAYHNNERTDIPGPPSCSRRAGIYLDTPAGTLSFYRVSSTDDTLSHLLTFHSAFTQPLCAALYVWPNSQVSLCKTT
ncbi:NLR family CARD domain-containing protein 3-like isoform X2 [Engraulis encrasicolus]|uniref:NLR family CARD domain-containing protein 3-like isoform X2 n=1 Tax=Engraulis encrasicolus TaxID=184585 RepID=UPI002FD5AD5D